MILVFFNHWPHLSQQQAAYYSSSIHMVCGGKTEKEISEKAQNLINEMNKKKRLIDMTEHPACHLDTWPHAQLAASHTAQCSRVDRVGSGLGVVKMRSDGKSPLSSTFFACDTSFFFFQPSTRESFSYTRSGEI